MVRWEPGAQDRLTRAAMELYAEHGYDQTTVADIAARAGVTSRTFFRYFADKREVLFAGSDGLRDVLQDALAAAPANDPPLAVVAAALEAVASTIGGDHARSAQRRTIIDANHDLQERERTKLASWADVLGEGLQRRGVRATEARLAAETGVAVFRVAFERWLDGSPRRTLVRSVRDGVAGLRALAGDTAG